MTVVEVFIGILLGTVIIMLIVILLTFIISKYERHIKKKLDKLPFIFLGKLDDSEANDDINKALKFLKLTNGIDSRK